MGVPSLKPIIYPEADGEPMAETDVHRNIIVWLLDVLRHRFRDERVYVTADLLLYYGEGDPSKCLAPDVMVVKDCDTLERGNFRIWDEQRVPTTIIEVTSKSTSRRDQELKPVIYGRIGVKELFLVDPLHEWLDPPLQGYTFSPKGVAIALEPDEHGRLHSDQLGITLEFLAGELILADATDGEVLRTETEAALEVAEQERDRAEREHERAERERARAEQERRRAEAERAKAEAERANAEAERARAEAECREKETERARAETERLRAERLEAELATLRTLLGEKQS